MKLPWNVCRDRVGYQYKQGRDAALPAILPRDKKPLVGQRHRLLRSQCPGHEDLL